MENATKLTGLQTTTLALFLTCLVVFILIVGQSFLLIADNYLKMNELLQAKATLNSLIDNFPDESIKQKARRKLDQINQLAEQETVNDTIR